MPTQIEMPRYVCHKEVHAFKIAEIRPNVIPRPTIAELEKALDMEEPVEICPNGDVIGSAGALLIPVETRYGPAHVDVAYMRKHQPQVGGYYVIYQDGYRSFSPAKPFEDGYRLIDESALPMGPDSF